ncbi:class I SAM-dependent methyltransferase [soil metagenome]
MSHLLYRTRSLLSYLWHGQGRYNVHSDFVYQFINQVLRDKKQAPEWKQIEGIRKQIKGDFTPITAQSFGAVKRPPTTASAKVRQTAISPLYGRLLYRCAAYFECCNILEIGTGTGISTLYLGSGSTVKRMVSLEGNAALATLAIEQINKRKLNQIEIIVGEFDSTLSTALGKLSSVDMVFIDGNHQKEPTLRYYTQILPYIHNETVLIFDDIHWSPDMQDAWKEIISRPEVTLSLDFYRMGLVFFRKEFRQPQHLQLYYW